ncbi:unnamed protein product [Diatraea saccharalis]|uniref:Regulator of G-protein signaling loco n=1 Tax=Diatraea saccharalis TaxID=40085 RepID=A0A9N9WIM8_9NEOP|nr:unnamed protein product [Diatraea saccharalis]
MMHHPGCHAAPSTSGVNEILQNLSRVHLTSDHAARLECRAVMGYLGTIETPQAAATAAPGNVRTAVRKLRQERRPAAPVLLSVLPNALFLRRPSGQVLAQYPRERIVHAGCGSEADRRFFGLVTSAESQEAEASHSCHVFAVDPRMAEHEAHMMRAREFQVACTRDPVAERCLEFPPSAEYVVGVIRGMYSLPAEENASPGMQSISKLAIKGDSPALGNFSRCNRAAFRIPRERRPGRPDDDGPDFMANSPQPSNHSEVTTTSSNSDSGIGFHNDCRNIADRILVVDFARGPPVSAFVREPIRRPVGLVGCGFDADGSFLSNAFPVVDGFAGQGRPLNLDDVMLNANEPQPVRRPANDGYDYNGRGGAVYDHVCSEGEGLYEAPGGSGSVEIYEERWGADGASVRSARSHDEPVRVRRHHLQTSLDDMLVLRPRDTKPENDDDNFVHPASVKCKVRKSIKPLNILSKTKNILSGRDRSRESRDGDAQEERHGGESRDARRRALSASCGEVCSVTANEDGIAGAASEPDLRDTQSEQTSPFRRWTTGSGAGSSYRHHDHRNMYNKQISEGAVSGGATGTGGVARWSLGLEQLLADPAGAAAFAHFLSKEFAAENIRFWWSCEQYSKTSDPCERAALAAEIWQRHLDEKAPEPVNVDAAARRAATLRLCSEPSAPDLFHQAQKQIFNVMKFDSYPRFLRSSVHAECARADLCGLPPPYAPRTLTPTDTPTKLKKSASNASERRRSGGASLLPWKLRTPSRDRNPAPPPPPPLTDVVKSSQWSGQCSLCRVVLPDGATSVVGVEAAVTVRQLVERLLQRRNLTCNTYDVLLKDPHEGESANIDLSSPSSVLGGREVRVERRVVVRIEVAGRCVAVRCGRTRRLRHVLPPVLARYLPAAAPHRYINTQPSHLHVDTRVQELEGARLQIVEVPDKEEPGMTCIAILRAHARDNDTDSIQENHRIHDDAQSISVASTSSRSHDYSGTNGFTDTIGLPVTNDFLDNLRETQRQRLQNKCSGSAPRAPPPLPPKPPQRPPTLV